MTIATTQVPVLKKLLIVGIGSVPLKYLVRALQPYGYAPVLLGSRQGFAEQILGHLHDVDIHEVDTRSAAQVSGYIRAHHGAFEAVVAVTSLFDEQFPMVETLAREFGWASPGPVPAWLSHKNTVLSLIPEYSPPSLCFKACDLRTVDLRRIERWGPQLVIKPACCSGGLGLRQVHTSPALKQDLQAHIEHFGLAPETEWVLQQHVGGRLLSFEGFVERGWVRRFGVSSRSRIGFTEVANRYPADDDISQAIIARGWDCIESLVHRTHFQYGYFHCEFIQTDTSVYLVDANMGRIGGATVMEQVAQAHDIDPHALLAHVLLLPVLRARSPVSLFANARLAAEKTLGIWYGLPQACRLEQLQLGRVRGQHTQFATHGAHVPAMGESDYAWVGMLCGLEQEVLFDIHCITLHTDKGVFEPVFSLD